MPDLNWWLIYLVIRSYASLCYFYSTPNFLYNIIKYVISIYQLNKKANSKLIYPCALIDKYCSCSNFFYTCNGIFCFSLSSVCCCIRLSSKSYSGLWTFFILLGICSSHFRVLLSTFRFLWCLASSSISEVLMIDWLCSSIYFH